MILNIAITGPRFSMDNSVEVNITPYEAIVLMENILNCSHSRIPLTGRNSPVSLYLSSYNGVQFIDFIKDLRAYTGCGLMTAKRIVDRLREAQKNSGYEEEIIILPRMQDNNPNSVFNKYCDVRSL